jgi:hypothetical protein
MESLLVELNSTLKDQEKMLLVKKTEVPQEEGVLMEGGYLVPTLGGCYYRGVLYTQHALERMAPCTPEIIQLLVERARPAMQRKGSEIKSILAGNPSLHAYDFRDWWLEYCPEPRGILPAAVEAEMIQEGSTNIRVITSEDNAVITVITAYYDEEHIRHVNNIRNRIQQIAKLIESNYGLFVNRVTLVRTVEVIPDVVMELRTKPNKDSKRRLPEKHDQRIEGIIQRKSQHTRTQTVVLENTFKDWEKKVKQTNSQSKTIDISAWKASKRATLPAQACTKTASSLGRFNQASIKESHKKKLSIVTPCKSIDGVQKEDHEVGMDFTDAKLSPEPPGVRSTNDTDTVASWEELLDI